MQGLSTGVTEVLSAVLTTDDLAEVVVDSRLWYLDTDTGTVYGRETLEGDDVLTDSWTDLGHLIPPGDGVAPSQVTGLVVTPVSVEQTDGAFLPGYQVEWDAVPEGDVINYEVQYDLTGTTWATPYVIHTGTDILSVLIANVLGATDYDFRVRALDVDSLAGPWSDTVTSTSLADTDAPSVPDSVAAASGFRSIGVTWSRAVEPDFAFFQVRYYDITDPDNFALIQVKASRIIITELDPAITYGVQVRCIDRSHNVATSDADPTAVDYLTSPEAGWSVEVQATPSLIIPADLAVNSVIANFISTGELSADIITSGTLLLGNVGALTSLLVKDSLGNDMAEWTDDGLVITDPNDGTKALWLYGDSIKFSDEYTGDPGTTTWLTAIDSRGVNAAAILFGTETGGYNRVPNAGMELAAFPATARTSKVWTITTDWDDATSTVNLNVSGSALEMTAV